MGGGGGGEGGGGVSWRAVTLDSKAVDFKKMFTHDLII